MRAPRMIDFEIAEEERKGREKRDLVLREALEGILEQVGVSWTLATIAAIMAKRGLVDSADYGE